MYTLISFATQWGSKYGGINSFNTDFLSALGVAYHLGIQVVCVVTSATSEEIEQARNAYVTLIPLPYSPTDKLLSATHAQTALNELKRRDIVFDPTRTVWLGHDRITGAAAIAAAQQAGGRAVLMHHMSYDHYESYAENSATAKDKVEEQKALFRQADIAMAIGPVLRDALSDILGAVKSAHMLVPGLADISLREAPKTFTAFLSGRLNDETARIKQGHLGVAAFAQAHRKVCDDGMPDGLCRPPKLVLRGVDFETQAGSPSNTTTTDAETELKRFAQGYAQSVINLQALPYTHDRQVVYDELSGSSVALMPSWHEGFGLVAWEAIAAGVPLIIGENSGVYRLLEELYPGSGTGCVYPVKVRGDVDHPFFREEDLQAVMLELIKIANKPGDARRKAGALRNILEKHTWPNCAEEAVQVFGWNVRKGSVPPVTPEQIAAVLNVPEPSAQASVADSTPLQIPARQWKAGGGLADSQLLRAEEALVPFDPARQPDLDTLNSWLDDREWPNAVRLITGAGGLGKTRLALELCQQRVTNGWHTGFLDAQLEPREMKRAWEQLYAFDMPVLVVIDYAETRQPVLLAFVKAILQQPGKHPVRILLLARDGGEWWDNLPSKDSCCEALLSGYATTGPYTLSPLHPEEEGRRHAYRQALNAFADALGVSVPEVTPELAGEHFGRPLYLQMAALLALHGERPTTAEGLTRALLNHERRYWNRLLTNFVFSEPEQQAQQLLALTTLAGGFDTPRDAQIYWNKTGATKLSPAEFSSLFKALVPLYPGKQGLQAVRPDLLGEALVAQALVGPDAPRLLDAVLANGSPQVIRCHSLTILARLSGKHPDLHETLSDALARHFAHCYREILTVAIETNGYLSVLAENAFSRLQQAEKGQIAGLLEPQLKEESIGLAELGCLVSEYLVEKAYKKMQQKQNKDTQTHYTGMLINFSVSLHRVGRNDQSLVYALKAVELIREYYALNTKYFEHVYSTALGNYSNCLTYTGKYEAALEPARQALEIRKRLTQKNPDESGYAISLNNYAILLSEIGQNTEAIEYARHAMEIRQRQAQKKPAIFDPDYATTLSNYSNRLAEAEQNNDAIEYARKALTIRLRLAKQNPDRYASDYAASLSNYSSRLCDVGNYEEALDYANQSFEIHKLLVQKNPDRFECEFAMSLSNLSLLLSVVGKNDDAYRYTLQAVGIYQRQVLKTPRLIVEKLFNINCLLVFMNWLSFSVKNTDLQNIFAIPTGVPCHRQQRIKLYSSFVLACCFAAPVIRENYFDQVIIFWNTLSRADRVGAEPYWLCSAAWCAKYAPAAVVELDWETDWQKFAKQRQGRIPHWMLEVARRLEFQWPDWTEQSDEPTTPVAGQP
ncbi:tetratricopeptide repeat protein [Trichlorobacter lovleyi]|uniref:tetratricopeptide repeat protein n=1 Tax=Trichlorobacter lovleyi TaxID=313985 RepID=UPI002240325F|nr:tetratricopeptide repeat protein [Trichlorobacter lovleyi]QOX78101.1 tetratricopeptide repeat protein [Trichlorobacter lovleyi]